VGSVARIWESLTPPLDESSLLLLKAFIHSPRPISMYKAAREAGLSLSLAYKKGRSLESLRLIHPLENRLYTATVKACIASLVRGSMGQEEFMSCVKARWPLDVLGVSDEEALSLLYALGIVMRARGLDLTKATICNYDEASLHVFKVYLASVVAGAHPTDDVGGRLRRLAGEWGVEPRVVAAAFRAAVKGILTVVPPTVVTPRHRILAVINSGSPRVVAVDCRAGRCRYYEEEVGLTCPAILMELARKLRELNGAE
jgi:hypothetical protein